VPYDWSSKRVVVTGGASFIGSHIVDGLVDRGATVRVVDDFSSGVLSNIQPHLDSGAVELMRGDLRDPDVSRRAVGGTDLIFHLAADHGGRGYVDLHQYACATNFGLDSLLFRHALEAGVEKVVYASSGCIYPLYLQNDTAELRYLTEDMAGPPFDPDGLYGMAKLAAERTLRAMVDEVGFKAASCRYFTVYGPRGVENHAVMAMIARAFLRQDPFHVWGTGEQIRNWTYVEDIAEGTIRAAESIDDGTAVNLGTMERVRVLDAVRMVIDYAREVDPAYEPAIITQPDMPTGPYNRVADNALAGELLDWKPAVGFADGLRRTLDWYFAAKDVEMVRRIFDPMLTGRGAQAAEPATAISR
jgi:nucleoside-diphosphate-sugar epimerase